MKAAIKYIPLLIPVFIIIKKNYAPAQNLAQFLTPAKTISITEDAITFLLIATLYFAAISIYKKINKKKKADLMINLTKNAFFIWLLAFILYNIIIRV